MDNLNLNIQVTKFAPIVLFVYNRPRHTKQTIESLLKNKLVSESELFVFCDGPKKNATVIDKQKILETRSYIHSIQKLSNDNSNLNTTSDAFKSVSIFKGKENKGLANSIIDGVTEIIDRYGKVIVLEDDIVTSPYFLRFMNLALEFYEKFSNVYSICGYNLPLTLVPMPKNYKKNMFFLYRSHAWGWGTWKYIWNNVDWEVRDYFLFEQNRKQVKSFYNIGYDLPNMLKSQIQGEIDSWAIRFAYHHFKNRALCVYPVKSYVNNIGLDGTGVHCGNDKLRLNNRLNESEIIFERPSDINKALLKRYKYYGLPYMWSGKRIVVNLKTVLKRLIIKCIKLR